MVVVVVGATTGVAAGEAAEFAAAVAVVATGTGSVAWDYPIRANTAIEYIFIFFILILIFK